MKKIGKIYLQFHLWLLLNEVAAQCNECLPANDMACYSATEIQACTNSVPTGIPFSCPTNYVCTATTAGAVCRLNATNVAISCNNCFKCDPSLSFACTGPRSYALCLNTTKPASIGGACASNQVCSIDIPYICGTEAEGVVPTCSYADGTTTSAPVTTPNTTETTLSSTDTTVSSTESTTQGTSEPTTVNPVTYCGTVQQQGRFPYGTQLNTTCKQYIFCYLLNGTWRGVVYNCPGSTYFNETTQNCGTAVPTRCIA